MIRWKFVMLIMRRQTMERETVNRVLEKRPQQEACDENQHSGNQAEWPHEAVPDDRCPDQGTVRTEYPHYFFQYTVLGSRDILNSCGVSP